MTGSRHFQMGMIAAMVVRPSLRFIPYLVSATGSNRPPLCQAGAGLRITWNAITAADPTAALR